MNTQRFFTVGKMVERLQRPPGQIESAIRELKIESAIELNDLRYYSVDAEAKIADELERRELGSLAQRQKQARSA